MERWIEHTTRFRAGGICEYCHLPESVSHFTFPIDHIIARQHGGESIEENLALACPWCNQHKGPNLAGLDPETGELTRLFHPRRDRWRDHFRWDGATLVGVTPVGRTTTIVLATNDTRVVALRRDLMATGVFPRDGGTGTGV
ncbi:MAG TPA: HNH endonuclease signature motif containing protein [Tepidisphaeraceae bacterium]|nr:HNH endonuclease signature motif containing protein [Tepidisphaeraceae bacterium]